MTANAFPHTPTDMTVGELAKALVVARADQTTCMKLIGAHSAPACVKSLTLLLDPKRRRYWQSTDAWLAAHPAPAAPAPSPSSSPSPPPAPALVAHRPAAPASASASASAPAAVATPVQAGVPAEEPDSVPPEPPPWLWAGLARWVRPAKGDSTYEPGKHSASLLALSERIERDRLRPELVDRFLPGLSASLLRDFAADGRVCVTLEFNEAMAALHRAADRIAAPLPDLSPPAGRLDLDAAGAWIDRLHPVIPPGADIVHLRPNQDPERMRGKAPGLPTHAGSAQWHAVSWRPHWEPGVMADRRATLQRLVSEGANVGLRLGAAADGCNLIALDLDTEPNVTRYLLDHSRRFVRERTGLDAPLRFGRVGRAMLLLRCKEGIRAAKTTFEGRQQIECLAQGQQIAFDGQHPSGTPYRTEPLLHELVPAELPELTVSEVAKLMRELRELAEVAGLRVISKADARAAGEAKAPPNPDELAGGLDEVRELMALIPSPDDRHKWVEILAALKGGTLHEPGAGLVLALDWSHHESEAEVAETERVWNSITPHSGIAELRRHAGRPSSRAVDAFKAKPDLPVAEPTRPDPFPGPMAEIVKATMDSSAKPREGLAVYAALGGMAGACHGRLRFAGDRGMRLNLYMTILLGTGEGKEGALQVAEEVARAAGAQVTGKPASGAALEGLLMDYEPLLVQVDEAGHLLAAMNAKNAANYLTDLASAMLQAYSRSSSTYHTRARATGTKDEKLSRAVHHPVVNAMFFATPERYAESVGAINVAGGDLGRHLFYIDSTPVRQRRVHGNFTLPANVLERARHIAATNTFSAVELALGQPAQAAPIKFDRTIDVVYAPGVEALLQETMDRFSDRQAAPAVSPLERMLAARGYENSLRVAGVLAVWDNPAQPELRADHVAWAESLVARSIFDVVRFMDEHMHESKVLADAARVKVACDRLLARELKAERLGERECLDNGLVPRRAAMRVSRLDNADFNRALSHMLSAEDVEVTTFQVPGGRAVEALKVLAGKP